MTQVLILLGVFLLALMLHYFVVLEGFEGTVVSPPKNSIANQTPFSELIDKLTFFSTASVPPVVALTAPVIPVPVATAPIDTSAKASDASNTNNIANKTNGAPVDAIASAFTKNPKIGPKDIANESIAERMKQVDSTNKISSTVTNVLQQGNEYLKTGCKPKPRPGPGPGPGPSPGTAPCPGPSSCKCPEPKPVPFPCNSSDYIRKDQIPCWGCSLK